MWYAILTSPQWCSIAQCAITAGFGVQVDQTPRVGHDAELMDSPTELIYETKRIIGRKYSDVPEEVERMSYSITEGVGKMAEIHVKSINSNITPETVWLQ